MGSATAWWLARRGVAVALLERFEAGHERGSSHGASRIFRLAYREPEYVTLALEARDLWRELEDDTGATLLEITGGVDHGPSEVTDDIAAALRGAGRPVEVLTTGAAVERFPGMRFDNAVVYSPDSGHAYADRAVAALQRRARELGADIRFGCGAVEVDPARRSVRAGDDEVRARRSVVVTAGAWVARVLGSVAFVRLPRLTVTREQTFQFAPAASDRTPWPSFIHHTTPASYGLATPGFGVKVAEHGSGHETDPDERSFEIDQPGRARVIDYVERWFPGLVPVPISATTCLYTTTPDASFVIERFGDLVVGSPCSGHGFKFTPAIGRRLADLAVAAP